MGSDVYDTYVVAVRRERRDMAPDDWLDRLVAIEGSSVVAASGRRAQILATPAAAERIRAEMGDYLLIEPVIEHRPLRDQGVPERPFKQQVDKNV